MKRFQVDPRNSIKKLLLLQIKIVVIAIPKILMIYIVHVLKKTEILKNIYHKNIEKRSIQCKSINY